MPYKKKKHHTKVSTTKTTSTAMVPRKVPRNRFPMFPIERLNCTLKWAYQANYTVTTATPSVGRTFRINSLLDPDTDVAVSTQPQYRDQMFALYDKCRVISATVIMKCITNTDTPVEILVGPQMNSALIGNVLEFRNQKLTKTKISSAGKPAYFKQNLNIARLLGQHSKHTIIDDQQEQFILTGPTISADYQILFNNLFGVATLTTATEINIYFKCVFSDPKLVAVS